MYVSTKRYDHDRGYSIAYRQYKADSHCRLIHGYSLAFDLEFESETLDVRNWCVDFGSLRTFKEFLDDHFDHTMVVAEDDPEFDTFKMLEDKGLCKLTIVEKTGCEGLAKFLYDYINEIWLPDNYPNNVDREIRCRKVRVWETPSNSAWYEGASDGSGS